MDITQTDRDKLRLAQHKLNQNVIGGIIEHKVQDPKVYKQATRTETMSKEQAVMSEINYKSKYLHANSGINGNLESTEEDIDLNSLPIDVEHAKMWLNMEHVEFDKLEWMSNKADKIHQERIKGATLFDKNGRALPASKSVDLDQSKTQPEAGAHDLKSLVNLLDSVYDPQVAYSLNVITKIVTLASLGYYDGAFDVNVHDILLKDCLLRVRHHLDSPNETVCISALKCLRSILCNTQVDEILLDRFHPVISAEYDPNLWLRIADMDVKEFTIEMKDNECVEIDAVLALLERTNILARFNYLLANKTSGKLASTYHHCILDILIRISRHSPKVCNSLNKKDLLTSIIELFLPSSIQIQNEHLRPLSVKALKLIRLVAQSTVELGRMHQNFLIDFAVESKIPNGVLVVMQAYFHYYLACSNVSEQDLKLNLENLRAMKVLCQLKEFQKGTIDIIAMGWGKLVEKYRSLVKLDATLPPGPNISADWQYAAHLVDLTDLSENYMAKRSVDTTGWMHFLKPVLFQWLSSVIRQRSIPHIDVSITLATAVQHYRNRLGDRGIKALNEVMIDGIIDESKEGLENGSDIFKILASAALKKSQLPGFLKNHGRLRDPKGLPSFGCLNYNTSIDYQFDLNPVFQNDSPFILLNVFTSQLAQSKTGPENCLKTMVNNIDLIRYIKLVTDYNKFPTSYESSIQQSLMAQHEIQIVARSLLSLGQSYLENPAISEDETKVEEPIEQISTRVECYSNLCHYTILTVALLNPSGEFYMELRDNLIEKILLNPTLQYRLTKETIKNLNQLDFVQMGNIVKGQPVTELPDRNLQVLLPVYTSSVDLTRYWIFKPLIDYHLGQLNGGLEACRQMNEGIWFEKNQDWRNPTGELATCYDKDIISIVLLFNNNMMLCSPAFTVLAIKPNLEDYLCLLGSLFFSDDIFLDEHTSVMINSNLRTMLSKCLEKSSKGKFNVPFQDASKLIGPLNNLPLSDFFNRLVDQFEAVSYGNEAFANFLLLFITPRSDKIFRRKLFQEKSETCLRQIRIGPDEVLAPSEIFFEEREKDPELVALINRSGPYLLRGSFLDCYKIFHVQASLRKTDLKSTDV